MLGIDSMVPTHDLLPHLNNFLISYSSFLHAMLLLLVLFIAALPTNRKAKQNASMNELLLWVSKNAPKELGNAHPHNVLLSKLK